MVASKSRNSGSVIAASGPKALANATASTAVPPMGGATKVNMTPSIGVKKKKNVGNVTMCRKVDTMMLGEKSCKYNIRMQQLAVSGNLEQGIMSKLLCYMQCLHAVFPHWCVVIVVLVAVFGDGHVVVLSCVALLCVLRCVLCIVRVSVYCLSGFADFNVILTDLVSAPVRFVV